jgi:hypothetical protein
LSIHVAGIIGLVVVFLIGTLRPINLGALALVMMFVHGTIFGQSVQDMYRGFPVDLFVLLAGVTYLFGVASSNGTLARMVEGMARLVGDRRALIPWSVFIAAALPTMAGALTATSVALLVPISLRLARRYDIAPPMIGLMVAHGAMCGNYSPLNAVGRGCPPGARKQWPPDIVCGTLPGERPPTTSDWASSSACALVVCGSPGVNQTTRLRTGRRRHCHAVGQRAHASRTYARCSRSWV